jgi:hypothetical protein
MTDVSMTAALRLAWPLPLVFACFVLCSAAPAQAQQFSADLVRKQGTAERAPAGRLSVVGAKVRIETPDLPDGFLLIDGTAPTAYFVRPAVRVYMDARQSSPLTRWFVSVDPEDPCRQWQAMARLAGTDQGDWRCERAGEDIVAGRRAIVFRAMSGASEQFLGWIDPVYKFPLQIKTGDGAIVTADNIQDMPQPPQPMQIPQSFRKFDPEMLLRQIKQSDVWVTSP